MTQISVVTANQAAPRQISRVWLRGIQWGTLFGALSGAIVGTGFYPVVGTVVGAVVGMLAGFLCGLVLGLFVAIVRETSDPVRMNPKDIALVGAVLPMAGASVALIAWVFGSMDLQMLLIFIGLFAPVIFSGGVAAVLSAYEDELGHSLPSRVTFSSYVMLVALASGILVFVTSWSQLF